MAAKPKAKKKAPPRKTTTTTPAVTEPVHPGIDAAPTPIAATINDIREDDAAVLGHFVEVTKGEHKSRYGVFEELGKDGKTAVVRTRDADSIRLTCPVADLIPAQAGRR